MNFFLLCFYYYSFVYLFPARIADPSGNTVPIRNLRVAFEDMNRRPPQPTLGKKLLSEVVGSTPWDRSVPK